MGFKKMLMKLIFSIGFFRGGFYCKVSFYESQRIVLGIIKAQYFLW